MTSYIARWILFTPVLFANLAHGTEGPRFSSQVEATIGVIVGNQEQAARLWEA